MYHFTFWEDRDGVCYNARVEALDTKVRRFVCGSDSSLVFPESESLREAGRLEIQQASSGQRHGAAGCGAPGGLYHWKLVKRVRGRAGRQVAERGPGGAAGGVHLPG